MPYLFKLKLLNGPLFGRELKLREGVLKLGSDAGDADIVLPLEGETQCIELHTADGVISLTPSLPGWVGNKPVLMISQLPIGQPVMVAGVGLVIGHVDDDLSHFGQWQTPATGRQLDWRMLLAGILLLAITSFCVLWMISSSNTEQTESFDAPRWVEQFAKTGKEKEIRFSWTPDNTLEIQGWCRHESALAPLLAQMRQHQIAFVNKSVCQDRLLNNVQYVIQLYGYEHIQIEPGESHGDVIINGAIEDDNRWQEVEKLLGTMTGLKKWSVVNQSDSQIGLVIKQLKKSFLLGKLSIRKSNGRIILSGKLNDKDVDTLAAIIRKFMQENPSASPMVFQNIQATDAEKGVLPAPIISVGGNANSPYLELSNGMRLQKGAELPSGYVIRNIDSVNGVELSQHGQLVHIPLGF